MTVITAAAIRVGVLAVTHRLAVYSLGIIFRVSFWDLVICLLLTPWPCTLYNCNMVSVASRVPLGLRRSAALHQIPTSLTRHTTTYSLKRSKLTTRRLHTLHNLASTHHCTPEGKTTSGT